MDPLSLLPDNIEKGQDVYISTTKGESAFVRLKIDSLLLNEYSLHQIDSNKKIIKENIFSEKDLCSEYDCIKEILLPKGDYAIYYAGKDIKKYLHIIEYNWIEHDITYIQFGNEDGPTCENGLPNGCYSKEIIEEKLKNIFKDAFVKFRITEKNPTELGLSNYLLLNFTENKSSSNYLLEYFNQIRIFDNPNFLKTAKEYEKIAIEYDKRYSMYLFTIEKLNECTRQPHSSGRCNIELKEKHNAENDFNQIKSIYNDVKNDLEHIANSIEAKSGHYVLGINEMRILWNLNNHASEIHLNEFYNYNLACTIWEQRNFDDYCVDVEFPMFLTSSCSYEDDKPITAILKDFDEKSNTFRLKLNNTGNLNPNCNYSIYADVYPFVPSGGTNVGIPVQLTQVIYRSAFNHEVVGGLVWGSHINGEMSLNTIAHEIGHLFGMQDLVMDEKDPTFDKFSLIGTNETNLMNYSIPNGPKIRYRPLQVAETTTGNPVYKNGKIAYEKQWDCIRNSKKCYIP